MRVIARGGRGRRGARRSRSARREDFVGGCELNDTSVVDLTVLSSQSNNSIVIDDDGDCGKGDDDEGSDDYEIESDDNNDDDYAPGPSNGSNRDRGQGEVAAMAQGLLDRDQVAQKMASMFESSLKLHSGQHMLVCTFLFRKFTFMKLD